MVATDAIGIGLNMDVDHVAFAQTRKFNGRNHRELQLQNSLKLTDAPDAIPLTVLLV